MKKGRSPASTTVGDFVRRIPVLSQGEMKKLKAERRAEAQNRYNALAACVTGGNDDQDDHDDGHNHLYDAAMPADMMTRFVNHADDTQAVVSNTAKRLSDVERPNKTKPKHGRFSDIEKPCVVSEKKPRPKGLVRIQRPPLMRQL